MSTIKSSEGTEQPIRPAKDHFSSLLGYAFGLSAGAGLIHLMETQEHFEHWFGYGLFFLIAGIAQLVYAVLVAFNPGRSVLLTGLIGHILILLLYLTTRTVGIPFFGPDAWAVEPVGAIDLISKTGEGILMIILAKLLKESALVQEKEFANA